jgi:mono/diheme cytochrome c family protein
MGAMAGTACRSIQFATVMVMALVQHADASDAAARGKAVVDQWCRTCHQRVTDKPHPDMAPPFEQVVRREGRDEAFLVRFFREDHFPMTTFRLFDHEKADVISYLMVLRGDRSRN